MVPKDEVEEYKQTHAIEPEKVVVVDESDKVIKKAAPKPRKKPAAKKPAAKKTTTRKRTTKKKSES